MAELIISSVMCFILLIILIAIAVFTHASPILVFFIAILTLGSFTETWTLLNRV